MLTQLLKLPFRVVKRLVNAVTGGGRTAPAPARPSPSPRPAPRPAYTAAEADDRGHDHGHSHEHGHDHGHSHDHGHAAEPEAEDRDHGHSHEHGHDHGHSHGHGGPRVEVQYEETPNPNAMKFSVNVRVSDKALTLSGPGEPHPLARRLFAIPGVRSVFAINNFVTVTKEDAVPWSQLTHPITEALQEVLGG